MRDKILEYLDDECEELSMLNNKMKYLDGEIRYHAKKLAENEPLWHANYMARYNEEYLKCEHEYNIIYKNAEQMVIGVGLKEEFEKMLQAYLDR